MSTLRIDVWIEPALADLATRNPRHIPVRLRVHVDGVQVCDYLWDLSSYPASYVYPTRSNVRGWLRNALLDCGDPVYEIGRRMGP